MMANLTNQAKKEPHKWQFRGNQGSLPGWAILGIHKAGRLFEQARLAELAGQHAAAELLRDQAETIYDELQAKQAGNVVPAESEMD